MYEADAGAASYFHQSIQLNYTNPSGIIEAQALNWPHSGCYDSDQLLREGDMLETAFGKDIPGMLDQKAGANGLHEDAMKSFGLNADSKADSLSQKEKPVKIESANDKRRTEESKFFRDMYEKNNIELDPMPMGQGILQSLEQMKSEGKISMSHEQLEAEAKRIEERDAKEAALKEGEHEKLWSKKEIDQMVQTMVDRPKGIDVSNWQSSIDWEQVKDAGYQFAFMKATEGTDFIDHPFDQYRREARDAGLKVGYYHFFQPEEPVDEQVNLFCAAVGKAEPDALRLVIDAEDNSLWQKFPVEQRAQMVEQFLTGVQNKLGMTPQVGIYCSRDFADEMLGNAPELKNCSLWIADWGPHEPPIPAPWDKWDFWQYTDAGNVPGIPDKVDLDVFNGADLNQLPQAKNPS